MSQEDQKLKRIGDCIDRLITLDLKPGTVRDLHETAWRHHGRSPAVVAAQRLAEAVRPMDTVIIITGALVSPFGTGETDGPIGSAALARALSLAVKARPLVLTMPSMVEMVSASVRAAGLNVLSPSQLHQVEEWLRGFAGVGVFPIDDAEAVSESRRWLDEFKPAAVISVEATGPNSKGIYHNYGRDFSQYIMKAGRLFEEATRRGVLTIGVGDRGNEIGFGVPVLHEAARRSHPYGVTCRCPCEAGAADVTPVDVTVVATVSNWGAYGIEAALAAVLRNRDAMHGGVIERRMLHGCSQAGGVDGRYQTPDYLVDSLPESIQVGLVEMLGAVLAAGVDFAKGEAHDPYGKGKY